MAFKQFWVVWSDRMGIPTKKHDTEDEAKEEAKRLAVKHPDHEYFVLMSVGSWKIRTPDPTWVSACER